MWWNKVIFGLDAYHVILWFLVYSMLGWAVESIYMSICNHKLINRGFTKGPFCPIYGVGALTVFFILQPYSDNGFAVFILGALLATTLEVVTAFIMNRVFGEIWWNYEDKPLNYKGIICLESSIAWGFYTIFLFMFLHNFVIRIVNAVPTGLGRVLGSGLIIWFAVDFIIAIYKEKKDAIPERVFMFRDTLINRIRR